MSDQAQAASWSELLSGRNGLRSLALAGGVALHAINVFIVATILPSVVADIGGLEYYAWNMALFVAASILGSALVPKLADKVGLRQGFLVAIFIFVIGTIVCAAAPSMEWLLVGRTAQGLGGGLLLGLCYSASRVVFEPRLWSRAMALISSMWGVATLLGPAIGGIFAELGAWRWAFWSILPVALGLTVLVVTQLSSAQANTKRQAVRIPFAQIILLVLSVFIVSFASLTVDLFWNVAGIVISLALAVLVSTLDQRSPLRLLPSGGYRLRGGLGGLYACVGLLSVGITVEIFIPYFLQIIHGYSPLSAGYLCALMSAGWSTGSIGTSGRSPKFVRKTMQAGPIISALSLAVLGFVLPIQVFDSRLEVLLAVSLPLFGIGLGIGMAWPHMSTQVFRMAPKGEENMASAAIVTVQLYAMAFGSALGGMVSNAAGMADPGGLVGAVQASSWLLYVIALAPAWAAFIMVGVIRDRPADM